MKNNNIIWVGIGGIILGVIIGTFCFGASSGWKAGMMGNDRYEGKHMMGNGVMMDDDMDMDGMMGSMMNGLEDKTGDDFDKAFLEEMIVHHKGAVEMAEKVLEVSTRPELRTLATNIISAQTSEITQMNTWLNAWFK